MIDSGEHVYFLDTNSKLGDFVRVGHSYGSDGHRIRGHNNDGKDVLAVLPASRDYEGRIHDHFRASGASALGDRSTYKGDEIWRYVWWLKARGYAAESLEDALHLPKPPWASISPECVGTFGEEESGQLVLGKIDFVRKARDAAPAAYHSSLCDEWFTPIEFIDAARRVMGGIDTDPASCPAANKRVGAKHYWSAQQSGLDMANKWSGRVWMNPPYGGEAGRFVDRLFRELDSGAVSTAIVLLNLNSMSTNWFSPIPERADAILVTHGRLKFVAGSSEQKFSSPATGSVVLYFGPSPQKFYDEFFSLGHVMVHWTRRKKLEVPTEAVPAADPRQLIIPGAQP